MPSQVTLHEHAFKTLNDKLTPSNPVKDPTQLRGRDPELQKCIHQLTYGGPAPFIYGNRGIGKTSLAISSAQQVCKSDREPIYIACAPGMSFVSLISEALIELSHLALKLGLLPKKLERIEATVSLSPALKFTWNAAQSTSMQVEDAASAVRLIRDFDAKIPAPSETVVILDELENLGPQTKGDFAYFVKQMGDQGIRLRFVYVGIAENIHQVMGEHASALRYLKQIKLGGLGTQHLIDIVMDAAQAVEVAVPRDILFRIAIVANGYPYFSHLLALHILTCCVMSGERTVTEAMYRDGLNHAVSEGNDEKLAAAYNRATWRRDSVYARALWAMADSDIAVQNVDDIVQRYVKLARNYQWGVVDEKVVRDTLGKLRQDTYGSIIENATQKSSGEGGKVYRHVRFSEPLMSAYVRLRAEDEGVSLGSSN